MTDWPNLVEQRIADAQRAGAFDGLSGFGRPLALEDLAGVPAELRASYILLESNGFLPPELEARKEWLRLSDLLAACADEGRREGLAREAQRARLRYRLLLEQRSGGSAWGEYADALTARLERGEPRSSQNNSR
ncbi:MAG: DnaJ family domain-containing protein [Planctomycetota bacterium]